MKKAIIFILVPFWVLFAAGCGGSGDYCSPKATFQSMVKAAKAEDKEAKEEVVGG